MSEDELSEDGPFRAVSEVTEPSSAAAPASSVRADRYGSSPTSQRRRRVIPIAFGGAVVLVIGAWVIWAGFDGTSSSVEAQDKAHTVVSDHRVDITFDVSADRGKSLACAVEAQNEAHAVVGYKVVDVPASQARTQEITTTVLTVEPAVTGLIDSCWLT